MQTTIKVLESSQSIKLSESCGMNMVSSDFTDNKEEFYSYEKHL